jgi:predicted GH43/DUF377 family glycosyl hydrolase
MQGKWKKLGLIFQPPKDLDWVVSHCQLPVADHIGGDIFRVYFAARDKRQYSHIGFVDVDIKDPASQRKISQKPVLSPGPVGFFDEHGVYPSSIVTVGNKKYLYYIGWNQGNRQPLFYASIGLAISEDGGETFTRYWPSPIMARSQFDPCLVTSPNVFRDGEIWRMTYVSGMRWEETPDGNLKSFYHIKYAESSDGIDWRREGKVAIDFASSDESNIARSAVIKEAGKYKMWYSYIKAPHFKYRIGYAESADCVNWIRKDQDSGIDVTPDGFDGEMQAYPCVVRHEGKKYMFYNGNNFGKNGFGLAVLEE